MSSDEAAATREVATPVGSYEKHPNIPTPPSETQIWRYVDMAKFLALMQTRQLAFPRADLLGDHFEGSLARPTVDAIQATVPQEGWSNVSYAFRTMVFCTYASCWHANSSESAAMWELYGLQGIAIRSNVRRLIQALQQSPHKVFVGEVDYVDYETFEIPSGNMLLPFLYKRTSFRHEHEVRGLIQRVTDEVWKEAASRSTPDCLFVPVDLSTLVEKLYVSPRAPTWFAEVVQRAAQAYGWEGEVVRSDLDRSPLF